MCCKHSCGTMGQFLREFFHSHFSWQKPRTCHLLHVIRPESLKCGQVFAMTTLVKMALYLLPVSIQSCTAYWFLTISPKSRNFFSLFSLLSLKRRLFFAISSASSSSWSRVFLLEVIRYAGLLAWKWLPKISSLKFDNRISLKSTSMIVAARKQESNNCKKAKSIALKTWAANSLSALKHASYDNS